MSTDAQQVLADALQLSENERAEVAARLIHSLDPEVDNDYETSWSEEISRRLDEYDRGLVKAIPWDQAIQEIANSSNASS